MESETIVLERIARLDLGAGLDTAKAVRVEEQLAHLDAEQLAAFRDLRRKLDFRQLSGEAADAAVSAFLGGLASAKAD